MRGAKPTPERPLLVGILVDVSASMRGSMGDSRSRLETFRDSLRDLAVRARELSVGEDQQKVAPLVKLFAYGFGFGNPISTLFGYSGDPVRDLLKLPGQHGSTIPLNEVAEHWAVFENHLKSLARSMGGNTPMHAGFQIVAGRIANEVSHAAYAAEPVLFVLSDGMPSEGTGSSTEILNVAAKLQKSGTIIVSCYVTDDDIGEPRRLYGSVPKGWPPGAELMFKCASSVPSSSQFERSLVEYKWKLERHCRLFTQVNQSEILSEFMDLILSPLREDQVSPRSEDQATAAIAGNHDRTHVFVSYCRRDKRWLDRLKIYLKPLEREGLIDVWDDNRIVAGDDWKSEIERALAQAAVAILLISADFLASDFIVDKELPRLLDAAEQRGLVVLPLIISPSAFSDTPVLAKYQAANSPKTPLNEMRVPERDRVMVELSKRVRALAYRHVK